jgi:phospho-N-acetylmuramoyl-pentapeptide-transferase
MGGVMVLIPVLVITGVLNIANVLGFNLIGRSILVPMAVMIAFGILGAVDDLMGVKVITTGLLGRYKLLWQFVFALVTAFFLHYVLDLRSIAIPGIAQRIDIGYYISRYGVHYCRHFNAVNQLMA